MLRARRVNRIVMDRRPLLLLVSSASRLAMIAAARDVKELPERLAALVEARIQRLGVEAVVSASEVRASNLVRIGNTLNRSTTGQTVDFAKAIPYYLPERIWGEAELEFVENRLAETPCRAGGSFKDVIFPGETAIRLLESHWSRRVTH